MCTEPPDRGFSRPHHRTAQARLALKERDASQQVRLAIGVAMRVALCVAIGVTAALFRMAM